MNTTAISPAPASDENAPMASPSERLSQLFKMLQQVQKAHGSLVAALGEARQLIEELREDFPNDGDHYLSLAVRIDKLAAPLLGQDVTDLLARLPRVRGVGTHLYAILKKLRFNQLPHCKCKETMARMNELGVEGCEDHFDELVEKLKEARQLAGWLALCRGLFLSALHWKELNIDPLNPVASLVREAIERERRGLEPEGV